MLEFKLLAGLGIAAALLFGFHRFVQGEQEKGYARRQAEDVVATLQLQEKYRAEQARWQADYDAKGNAYEEVIRSLRRTNATRAAVAGGVRQQLAGIANDATQSSQATGNSCRAQDERIARGAGLLAEGIGLVAEGAGIIGELDAKVTALQGLAATDSSDAFRLGPNFVGASKP